jgi:D-xylose transport system permease protein
MSTPEQAAPPPVTVQSPRAEFLRRFLSGDLGFLRVVLILFVIWAIFYSQNDRFLSAQNLTNLVLQITAIGLISVGVVLVLLLGEIDLSVGAVSGLCAAVMAVLNVKHGWDPYLAIAAGVVAGALIGALQGSVFAYIGVPAFVVTLAGLLAWQGALLYVLGDTGTINITNSKIVGLANTFYSETTSWIIGAVAVVLYAGASLWGYRQRVAAGLADQALRPIVIRIALVAAVVIISIGIFNQDRGLPLAGLILVAFVAGFQYVISRTRYGRHIFALGGSIEAARRAGINIATIRVTVFTLAGTMAAIGGIMGASRLLAVNQSSGGSDLLLLAIAGPVVAGTSLFGGRGTVWSALLGALVIGSISNGMDLLNYDSSVKFMVTGGVLLIAVVIDAIARRQRQAEGRV